MTTTTLITKKTTTGYEFDIYTNNILNSISDYSASNRLLSTTQYNTDGKTIKQVTSYTYDLSGKMIGQHFIDGLGHTLKDIHIDYTTNGLIADMIFYNNVGSIIETDFYLNGVLHHIVKPVSVSNSANTTWSNISGYGEINALTAISSVIGSSIKDITLSTPTQWNYASAHFDDVAAAGYTGKGIVIANIDTGLDLTNKFLTSNLSKFNWNFLTNTSDVQDDNGHGSFTSSEMIATDNHNGIIGASNGAQLMVLKALGANGSGTSLNIANAIKYAVDHSADIINMSLNSIVDQPLIKTALQYAHDHNVLVSVSSGNNLGSTPLAPAKYATVLDNVIAVGASMKVTTGVNYAAFSNKAGSNTAFNYVDAPGVNLQGYNQNGLVVTESGTSMASALVASEMADVKQAIEQLYPTYQPETVAQLTMEAVIGHTDVIGLIGIQPLVI